ncbi:hypothetical protein IWW45_009206, partial [Coemansia sp. RSA 485]
LRARRLEAVDESEAEAVDAEAEAEAEAEAGAVRAEALRGSAIGAETLSAGMGCGRRLGAELPGQLHTQRLTGTFACLAPGAEWSGVV